MDAKGGTSTPPNPSPSRSAAGSTLASAVSTEAPESSKAMLQAFHFLRALTRIRGVTGPVRRRTRNIRRAAYSSMARAAGPRRVWSQALLRQARASRSTTRRTVLVRRRVVAGAAPASLHLPGRARSSGGTAAGETSAAAADRALIPPPRQAGEPSRTDALRRLVPGGAGMEYCSLLEETADYVRCLRAQVQLMQGLADLFSCQ